MSDWREKIKNHSPNEPRSTDLRKSAVVVPLYLNDDLEILLTSRTKQVSRHPGQICFPGGSQEPHDNELLDTGLRELNEEIGVESEDVEIIGELDETHTTTGFSIKPYVAELPYPYEFVLQESEVNELIQAPISDLTNPNIHEVKNQFGKQIHYFYYDNYTIWGATAEILAQLLRITHRWSP